MSRVIPREGRIAGIDFGTVRIGTSICDFRQSIASPLDNYNRRGETQDAKYFVDLAQQEQLVGFVVGLPVHMSGDSSQKSKQATSFGKWLEKQTGVPVDWIDERYTTAMAREILNQENLSGKKRKSKLDKIAAQIILMTYLERRAADDGESGSDHGRALPPL